VVGLAASAAPQVQGIFPVKKNGKIPLTAHGFKDTSSDPTQISQWRREFPGCNWGTPTGIAFVVLDLDAKHPESFEWWREQQDIHGPVETREVSTPSGGAHLYFLPSEGIELKSTASEIAPGVDTRAQGGYVVIPPSVIDGNPYEVTNDVPTAEMPGWLLEVWPKVGERSPRGCSPEGPRGHVGTGSDLLNTTLPERQRNVGLARIAGYLWNRLENLQELEGELLEPNARLCDPPLPNDEVLSIARSISRYPQSPPALTIMISFCGTSSRQRCPMTHTQVISSRGQPDPGDGSPCMGTAPLSGTLGSASTQSGWKPSNG
jgi:putative DNA primase/helicase